MSGRLASISAPFVENGLTSTIVDDTARAATNSPALTPPSAISGTAIGMITGSSAVERGERRDDAADVAEDQGADGGGAQARGPVADELGRAGGR